MGACCSALVFTLLMLGVSPAMAYVSKVPVTSGDADLSSNDEAYWVEELADQLNFPSAIVWLPDGDVLISEREGGLRRMRNGKLLPGRIAGLPVSFQNVFNGIKDVILDPDFRNNGAIYLLISEGTFEKHHAAVYRARYTPLGLQAVERIFRSKDDIRGVGHSAARMISLPDSTLLIAVPEDNNHKRMAQQLDSHIGKILRINRDGSIPGDNPFAAKPNALPEIWSYGHRIPTGIYRDPDTAMIWEVEPGPVGGDELNELRSGANFGWARVSLGFEYSGGLAAPLQYSDDTEAPTHVWTPSVTPSGITRYRGTTYPQWNGDFFIGQLSGKALKRLRFAGRRVVLQEDMLVALQERIREVAVGPDNHIYLLTDNFNGRLLRIRPGSPQDAQERRVARKLDTVATHTDIYAELTPGDAAQGKLAFIERCSGCHSIGQTVSGGEIGPDLRSVYGRNAGTGRGFGYSQALSGSPQVWDFITLNLFLADPAGYAPGTTMSAPPVSDPAMRRNLVGFLQEQSIQLAAPVEP